MCCLIIFILVNFIPFEESATILPIIQLIQKDSTDEKKQVIKIGDIFELIKEKADENKKDLVKIQDGISEISKEKMVSYFLLLWKRERERERERERTVKIL